MKYVATINTPGYLPMDDDPPVFDTIDEAWWYLYHERCEAEAAVPCDLDHDTLSYSPICHDLSREAEADTPEVGTVWGSTPGHDGDHDLGLNYSVSVAVVEKASPELREAVRARPQGWR